ncbi:MAG: SO_0444 family Cu/Zn efflux transporter [Candidatus Sumerlaeia bacterium]
MLWDHITGVLAEIWRLFMEMAPYLLLGLGVAGALSVLLPARSVLRHLSGRDFKTTLKAVLIGVPLPLCSCSVIPVAQHLRRQGASRAATLSFMISTPSTGVDSIMATYSLMGPLFAVGRVVADVVSGLIAGLWMNWLENAGSPSGGADATSQKLTAGCSRNESTTPAGAPAPCCSTNPAANGTQMKAPAGDDCCEASPVAGRSMSGRFNRGVHYAFVTLVRDIGWWLVVGIALGGLISYCVPESLVQQYLGNPWLAYPLMFAIGLPLYVCATGSIPIVAPLLMKGLAPGAALVFLVVGPATNAATMTVVGRMLGRRALIVYLLSMTLCAIGFGLILDAAWGTLGGAVSLLHVQEKLMPIWVKAAAGGVLACLFINALRPRRVGRVAPAQESHSTAQATEASQGPIN